MDPKILDTILNLVYFLVGLAVGIFGLWQNQKFFQAQQQDKFNEISHELRELGEHVALMSQTLSERAYAREDRLLSLATQQIAVETATEEAAQDIRAVVIKELERAGVSDAIQRTQKIEKTVAKIIADSTSRVVEDNQGIKQYEVLMRLDPLQRLILRQIGGKPFSPQDLGNLMNTSRSFTYRILARWRDEAIVTRTESGAYTIKPSILETLNTINE